MQKRPLDLAYSALCRTRVSIGDLAGRRSMSSSNRQITMQIVVSERSIRDKAAATGSN